ncbi:MAG TPA: sigma 54-interacting transcriptional regulator [Polyangiaceae bacterium]|nr:sigma 54-interacting transcriptional regulator [Polyangiaceae bacterium]
MSEIARETREDSASQERLKDTGLLIFVLRYDDLCAGDSIALLLFVRENSRLEIGRAARSGPPLREGQRLLLSDPFVSRSHAHITRRGGVDIIEDLGSRLGTFVNDVRIVDATPLADGDCIEMGHSLFVYRRTDADTALRLTDTESKTIHGPTQTLSPELVRVSSDLERIAPSDQPVLLLAETGAGKEIAARFVHDKSGRAGAFVAIDCGAIPPHLVESELFGHKRGAFSGAHEERMGRIRSAEGGTVFLDEIGNMPAQAQATLLRVVQEREVIPVGADKGKRVNVRWVAATNADLFSKKSDFRADLRARLSGYVAQLPPLRERREDLGFLCAHLLAKHGIRSASMTRGAARALFLSELSGNVRELEQALASAAVLVGEGPIDVHHLSVLAAKREREHRPAPKQSAPPRLARSTEKARDRSYTRRPSKADIEQALAKAKRVQSEAARLLGVHERQLARWMDAYGIERARRSALKNE